MKKIVVLVISLLSLSSVPAYAQLSIKTVQPPVWKESLGLKTAAFPGEKLSQNDKILTGQNSRIILDFNDGGVAEFGQDVVTSIDQVPEKESSITQAALKVIKGAFRYTADKLAAGRQREINIGLTTSTIGIRGTDVWGRSNENEDFIVLIEGDIEITHDSETKVRMNEAQSVYTAPNGKNPLPLEKIEVPELLKLAAETSLIKSQAALYSDGKYSVVINSTTDVEQANKTRQKYLLLGYPVTVDSAQVNDKTVFRSQINGLRTFKEGILFVSQIKNELNIQDAWILKASN